ncbi:sodium/proline symporter PutP [Testudinibacter sp. TR-2022]|uniref:sodium/proline symporter PutP n=1 Tax=Testudinibacter sp. TR-2022 TaxID=2585029 RepID=UPI0011196F44|nr:sodium/proline symporter PutP [Testudinibacter sp. TR-2022]TNH03383.1 sodium/proline symporter PutP [Pasteurellaceae bacterium Phil31]TNH10534.1 sodium/proline symporter PutP [Testudinibacter sp. TR-2022]TNH12554.1 sodium/proline symporter PutP [Testudinibacter sp. TR-2022]TNH12756.1 sodium/proline symporter PutP [Testudinibacter sp. TR-2022]TNH13770.1 sodium/proline symporter PutP [Testudinibacter sp. TR-2022]
MQNYQIYITFGLYLLIILGIGVYAYRSTQNFDDYILGGRKMGSFVTAMSAGASDMSGWLLMGLPGAIFLSGLSEAWIAVGLTIGAYFNYRVVAARLRIFTEKYKNALTLPEFFAQRFPQQKKALKIISSSIILFFFTIYCASGVVAGAKLFQSLLGLDYSTALWLGALATITYTFIGGYLAVSWSDTIQATLMIFALLLAPVMVLLHLTWEDINLALTAKSEMTGIPYANWLHNVSGIGVISALAWGLGYFGQPHILARFMAADSVQSLQNARKIGITWMFLCLGGAVAVGYFGLAYFSANQIPLDNAESVFIELSRLMFNPWIVGIVLSAILAAVMSTLSAQLLMCSAAVTEDFYKGFLRKTASSHELVWVGRFMVLVISAVAILIAQDPSSGVMKLVSYAWAGFGAAFGPVVILSLFNRNITSSAALWGMLCGAVTVVVWSPLMQYLGWADLAKLYEIIPGFLICSFITITSSLFSAEDSAVAEQFDQALAEFKLRSKG